MVPKNRHLSGKRVKIKNDQLQRLTVLMPKNQPVELQSPECEYGTCLLPPKTATSETRDMIGTSSKCQDPRANLWGWVGYRWVPEKIGRFTGLLKRSHGQSGWTYIGDPLKPQRYQGLCP